MCLGTTFKGHGGVEFMFVDYRLVFKPNHDNILGLYSNKVHHGIKKNIGYTQVGVILITKIKVVIARVKKQQAMTFLRGNFVFGD
jgi:hypothetical protein